MRRNSRSFIVWILFGIIIAVFIISFGPQASPDSLGCGHSAEFALAVKGEDVGLNSWRFAMNGLKGSGGGQDASFRRQRAIDLLVERELLAQAAEARGFRVSDEVVNQAIAAGDFYILGHRVRVAEPNFWRDFRNLERFSSDLGLASVASLVEEQRREHMADFTRHLFLASAAVSDEEVRQVYIQDNTRVEADYVKFDFARYRSALSVGEEEIARYAAENEADLVKAWESEKAQWSSDKPRLLARHILIEPAPAAKEPPTTPPADETPEQKQKREEEERAAAAKKAEADKKVALDKAREEANAVKARLAAGEDFGKIAREVSDDKLTAARGGVMGWRPAESLGYGKEVVEAAKKLDVGAVSDVIETSRGFHIVRIDEKSEKALTFEQKKLDLASKLAADHYARKLAKRDAEAALAAAKTKPLEELFERKAKPSPSFDPSQMQDLPPEILEQLQQIQMEQGLPQGGEEGLIVTESEDRLAQGGPDDSKPTPPATKPTPPVTKPATPPVTKPASPPQVPDAEKPPVTKPPVTAAGSGQTPAGAGGAGSTPAAPASSIGPDGLPVVDVQKPPLQSIGPVARSKDFLAGLGKSEDLLTDLFETIEVGKLSDKIYEVTGMSDAYVVVQLKSREDADMTKFDESKERLRGELSREKGVSRLAEWVIARCQDASKDGEVEVARKILEEEDDPSKKGTYQACATLNELSVAGQMRDREAP
ncbi:MAG TPA: peptidylprolyl isomerase [Kofleriaceae bacterium]|nr:peptidylprolyl isomerase [Kofleriaceae bacterium]